MLNLLSLSGFMFGDGKKKENKTSSSFPTSAPTSKNTEGIASSINIIGKGTTIEGDITADDSIRIEGVINGNLTCKARVIIGETGVVEGTVTCQEMEIMGKFSGKLNVKDTLIFRPTAIVDGTITYNKLAVDSEQVLTGTTVHRATVQKMGLKSKFRVI